MKQKKSVKLVVSDIDGTIIKKGEPFPQVVKQAVKVLEEKGIGFTFASGRLPYMITPYMEELGLSHMPVCACNGTLLYCGEKILEAHLMPIGLLRELIEEALNLDMTVLYAVDGKEYCARENDAVRRKRQERGSYHPIRPLTGEDWGQLAVNKVNILDDKKRADYLLPYEKKLESACHITHYGSFGLEIVAAGYGKEYGLVRLSQELKVPMDQILAIGDNENDDGMLTLAGIGAAVGNAEPKTKACADLVAEGQSGEGVAEIIYKVLERNRLL